MRRLTAVEGPPTGLARTLPTGAGTIIAGAWVFVVLSVVPLEAQDTPSPAFYFDRPHRLLCASFQGVRSLDSS